jgi:ankyrin repeat protein
MATQPTTTGSRRLQSTSYLDEKALLQAGRSKSTDIFDTYFKSQEYVKDHIQDAEEKTPLHSAVRNGDYDLCQKILYLSVLPVNQTDTDGNTALHIAVRQERREFVRLLLQVNGIDINAQNALGDTPLHIACKKVDLWMINRLQEAKANPRLTNHSGFPALSPQIQLFLKSTKPLTRDEVDIPPRTAEAPLLKAARCGNLPQAVKLLQDPNLDLTEPNSEGKTALHLAAARGNISIMELLLARPGPHLNATDLEGNTALHIAVRHEKTAPKQLLVKTKGVDINARNIEGNTPLHIAVQKGKSDMLRGLLDDGARTDVANNLGYTVWDLARGSIRKVMLEHTKPT